MESKTRQTYEQVRAFMLEKTEKMDWHEAIALYEELSADLVGNIDALKEENEDE